MFWQKLKSQNAFSDASLFLIIRVNLRLCQLQLEFIRTFQGVAVSLTPHYSAQPNMHHSIGYLENENLLLDAMQVQLMHMKNNSHYVCPLRFPMV